MFKVSSVLLILLGILIPFLSFTKYEIKRIHDRKKVEEVLIQNNYYAILEIDKINLKRELYDINDSRNNVNQNIMLHKKSVMPYENINSHIILAAHSGNGSQAYFQNLYLLEIGDIIKFYYQNKIWIYEIVEIEYQDKTGVLYLKEDYKEMITLITCTKGKSDKQTIYYGRLKEWKNV